jgi:hypothetical protein
MWDFVMDKSGAGAGFLRELRVPLPIYIPSASPQSSSLSPEAGTIGLEWPQCQKPHKPNNNNNNVLDSLPSDKWSVRISAETQATLTKVFNISLGPSNQMPGQYFCYATTVSFQILSN